MMNKLQRYNCELYPDDRGRFCKSEDVAVLEAENDKLIAALQECIIQRFYPEKVSEIAMAAILDHEQDL